MGGWWHAGHQEEGDKELVLWSQVQVACAVGKRALPLAAVWGEELMWLLLPKQGQLEAVLLSLSFKTLGWFWLV